MNLRLEIAYDGTLFRGYARQPDVRTVQGELEEALRRTLGSDVETSVAGRTDAGVHAAGQVVGVEIDEPGDLEKLRASLDVLCGPEIAVNRVLEAPDDWHPRFSARSRTYIYALHLADVQSPELARTTWLQTGDLEVERMNEAAGHLLGPHDFRSFGRIPDPEATPIRNLYELRCLRSGSLIRIRARANAFIQQMVRSLVGTLVDVGRGKTEPDEIPQIIAACDRAAAGPVAPPQGLCLVSVEYDDGWSIPATGGVSWA